MENKGEVSGRSVAQNAGSGQIQHFSVSDQGSESQGHPASSQQVLPWQERCDRVVAHIDGEGDKAQPDDAQRDGLYALTLLLIYINRKSLEERRARSHFDQTVEAETNDRDTVRERP